MTKKVETTAKAKKFQVFVGTELKAESNNHEEALEKVSELQKENLSEIQLVNHVAKVTHVYSKGRYDKNYRITGTDYVAPSKAVTEEAAAE
jgi:hypothetical protein